jgi:hypothetical protein
MLSVGSLPDVASQILLHLVARGLCSVIMKVMEKFHMSFYKYVLLGHNFNGVIM